MMEYRSSKATSRALGGGVYYVIYIGSKVEETNQGAFTSVQRSAIRSELAESE